MNLVDKFLKKRVRCEFLINAQLVLQWNSHPTRFCGPCAGLVCDLDRIACKVGQADTYG